MAKIQRGTKSTGAKKPAGIGTHHAHKAANGKPEKAKKGKGNPAFQLSKKAASDDPKESYVGGKIAQHGRGEMHPVGAMKKARKGMQPKFPKGGIP